MSFEAARPIADAVLLEGYLLYPYRASAQKNQYRWTFGALLPRRWSEREGSERWWSGCDCLVRLPSASSSVRLRGQLRFLAVAERSSELASAPEGNEERCSPGARAWQEGELEEIEFELELAAEIRHRTSFELPARCDAEGAGQPARVRSALRGSIQLAAERLDPALPELLRLRLRIENSSDTSGGQDRAAAMREGFASTHVLLELAEGQFVSSVAPPPEASRSAVACLTEGLYPALLADAGGARALICSPIILPDLPRIAPESPGDFFDACEIDELLVLRTLTLGADEKRELRATDARARDLLERIEGHGPELLERLHGRLEAARSSLPDFTPGQRVRLRPGVRRSDAQDLLFAGAMATIERVLQDIDGATCLAVTLDDDPAAELHRWYGRFHYYYLDEVEPVTE